MTAYVNEFLELPESKRDIAVARYIALQQDEPIHATASSIALNTRVKSSVIRSSIDRLLANGIIRQDGTIHDGYELQPCYLIADTVPALSVLWDGLS